MKNILTIDLDFLTEHLKKDKDDFIIKEPFKINIIAKLLSKYNKKDFIFLKTHGEVAKFITTKVNLYNFDHHHDIYYQDEAKNEIEKAVLLNKEINERILESCWVYYLYHKGLINEYHCFLNDNSELQFYLLRYGFRFYLNYYDQYDPYKINLFSTHFDKIFIIESPDYTESEKLKRIMKMIGLEGDEFESIKN